MGRSQPGCIRRAFAHFSLILTLVFSQSSALFATPPDLAAARTRAAQVFENRCSDCHDSPGDSESIFGDGWLPCFYKSRPTSLEPKASGLLVQL